jgi:hypothetical protein
MGKWLNQLREAAIRTRDTTDKTDKTESERVLSVLSVRPDDVSNQFAPAEEGSTAGFVSFVGSSSEPFYVCNGRYGWEEEDWQAAFDERAAILEFDENMPRRDAEALAWREIEAQRKRWIQ